MSATLTPGGNAITLQVTNPGRDDLVGMMVWCSTDAGFAPGPTNLVYDGADLTLQIIDLAPGVAHYVRYALISEIDPTDYDASEPLTATPVAAAEAGANKTYLDETGKIQGVSAGAGTAVNNTNIVLAADGTLTGAGASIQVSLTMIPGTLQATHLAALTMAAGSSITAGTESDGVKLDATGKHLVVMSNGVERLRIGYGVGLGAAYGLRVKNSLGAVMLDTADGVLMRGDIVSDNYSVGDATTGGVTAAYGTANVAIGAYALASPGTGKVQNVAIGSESQRYNLSGDGNVSLGRYALSGDSAGATGSYNVALGHAALRAVTTASHNVALGYKALTAVTTGAYNVALGTNTGLAMTTGTKNTALGHSAMRLTVGGVGNTAVGESALYDLVSGNYNTAVGNNTGRVDVGSYNLFLGDNAGSAVSGGLSGAVIVGGNTGADVADNEIILSDGVGNERARFGDGSWRFLSSLSVIGNVVGSLLGYSAGGSVSQLESKSASVTLNAPSGVILMNDESLGANAAVSFTVTNLAIGPYDVVNVCIASGATAGAYVASVDAVENGLCRISVRNMTANPLAEMLVINFFIIKALWNATPVDVIAPTLVISSDSTQILAGATTTITFTFDEDVVTSFVHSDITVTGGTLGPLSGTGFVQTAVFTAGATAGAASISVTNGAFSDAATNAGVGYSLALNILAADPYFSNVSLLMHMDGANGSTAFSDSSAAQKTINVYGGANISTQRSKFGGSSLALNNAGGFLSVANSPEFDFDLGDFTIECWFYLSGNSAPDYDGTLGCALVSSWGSETLIGGYILGVLGSASTTGTGIQFDSWSGAGGADLYRASVAVPQNTWHHVEASVQGGVRRIFLNGVLLSGVVSYIGSGYTAFKAFNHPLTIGRSMNSYYPAQLNGNIDELRITRGVSRHAADFTPPTAPFPNN